jgi:hypothetical protein
MLTPEYGLRIMGGNRMWQPSAPARAAISTVALSGSTTANLALWVDGQSRSVASTVGTAVNTAGTATVGTFTSTPIGPHNFAGDIAEIVVYDRSLPADERGLIEAYLAQKYAIALTP